MKLDVDTDRGTEYLLKSYNCIGLLLRQTQVTDKKLHNLTRNITGRDLCIFSILIKP